MGNYVTANPSIIKSKQTGVITIASTGTSGTATITAVDTTKAEVSLLGNSNDENQTFATSANNIGVFFGRLALTNATTLTFTRDLAGTVNFKGSFQVIERP